MNHLNPRNKNISQRIKLLALFSGLLIFIIGADPGIFNLDRSPVTGVIQIAVFLFGLAVICISGYSILNNLWHGEEKSIAADIGLRLISTGYLISFASGMADVLGFGTNGPPLIPYFGHLQATGVALGEAVIALGFILFIPIHRKKSDPG